MDKLQKYGLVGLLILLSLFVGMYMLSTQKGKSERNGDSESVIQSHRSYQIEVISNTLGIKPREKAAIKYKIKDDRGEILKNYEIAHEKIMHFITVRKDLAYFQHLHPNFNEATGEFSVDITFPEDGPYRIFPDFTPSVKNPQKLPVTVYADIEVGNINNYYAQNVVPDSTASKQYGEYEVKTMFPKDAKTQTEINYSLILAKNGKPVGDLENYLGALGHSVILKEGTLDFIHTHALEGMMQTMSGVDHDMESMSQEEMMQMSGNGPEIKFSTTFPPPGIYKIFTQFQHQGKVVTTDYTLKVN